MKMMAEMTIFSESECPHCGGFISYEQLYSRHFVVLEKKFEYQCVNCLGIIQVETEMTPTFKMKAAEQNAGAELTLACSFCDDARTNFTKNGRPIECPQCGGEQAEAQRT